MKFIYLLSLILLTASSVQTKQFQSPDTSKDIFIWLTVSLVTFFIGVVGTLITFLIKTIIKNQAEMKEEINKTTSNLVEISNNNSTLLFDKTDEMLENIGNKLSEFHNNCIVRSSTNTVAIKGELQYIDIAIRNVYNVVMEFIKGHRPYVCHTSFAVSFFSMVMSKHCMEKAMIIAETITRHEGNIELSLQNIKIKFRLITEAEIDILNEVIYDNNNRLGDTLKKILVKDTWENFINCTVKNLLEIYWTEKDVVAIYRGSHNCFWNIATGMIEEVRRLGESK